MTVRRSIGGMLEELRQETYLRGEAYGKLAQAGKMRRDLIAYRIDTLRAAISLLELIQASPEIEQAIREAAERKART